MGMPMSSPAITVWYFDKIVSNLRKLYNIFIFTVLTFLPCADNGDAGYNIFYSNLISTALQAQ